MAGCPCSPWAMPGCRSTTRSRSTSFIHPIRITARRIVPDTEGAGAFRGAPGILTEFRPVGTDIEIGFVSDGTVSPALGLRGGHAAAPARQYLRTDSGEIVPLGTSEQIVIRRDQTMGSYSNGRRRVRDPLSRDPQRNGRHGPQTRVSAQ